VQSIKDAAEAFLANKRVAVTGVSRTPKTHGSNTIYKRLRDRGYDVFAVNPNAAEVEGDRAYHDLRSIPGGVDAVVIATRPEYAEATMRECAELGSQTCLGMRPESATRRILWPKSLVGANISGHPPSMTVMPFCRP
jgi:predicted CoA-binding protein